MEISPRPTQIEILSYTGGTMGIAAVPGSGKTWTLSALAAQLIEEAEIEANQEILIVTLTNSAVDNFSARIEGFLEAEGYRRLMPPYRVRTLHGLAHDIARERPDLAGLDTNFTITDDMAADRIRSDVAASWLSSNPRALDNFLSHELEGSRLDWVRRDQLPKLVQDISLAFIRTAKDGQLTPGQLEEQMDALRLPMPLFEMGTALYADYQRALAYRGAVDFDDLIRLALQIINSDPAFLERLQNRWPYILEDEAQDSSKLQEEILKALAGRRGNWVRVGDPNQAIFESFTTANPAYLREFIATCDLSQELPQSGRSTQSIMDLANYLIEWTQNEHPIEDVRDALVEPKIEPVLPGDPQPNPEDRPNEIHLVWERYTPEDELNAVATSLKNWLPEHSEETVAVLVPRNGRGFALIDKLKPLGIEAVDSLLRSTSTTRFTAGALGNLLRYLGDPGNARLLGTIYQVWLREKREDEAAWAVIQATADLLVKCPRVEDYIWPRPGRDWLDALDSAQIDPEIQVSLLEFREFVRRWQGTVLLPVDQIVLTLAQDLFQEPSELALAHKLAGLLRQAENTNPTWRLGELAGELAVIARNERRFLGFSPDDTGFDPEKYKGQVVVSTMHKAKGLEWDRVYLISVNNYDFPSGRSDDRYISERWFIRDNLNLQAEALAQLEAAYEPDMFSWYQEGSASYQARMDYVRERLRLFYVGITRARKELIVTWNTGRRGNLTPSVPFEALIDFWEDHRLMRLKAMREGRPELEDRKDGTNQQARN